MLFMASCTSKATQRNASMGKAIEDGDYPAMVESIRKDGKKLYGQTNAFLYNMDLGVLFHYMGEYDSSNVYLIKAAEIHHDLFTKSVSNEAASLLTNDNVRPYRSKPYELIMMHQLTALNFMALGKFQEALVESRKAQLLMNEWERTQAKDGKYHTDGMFHLMSSLAYEGAGEADNSLISLFKSVEAYKGGPVKLPDEVEGFAYDRLKAGDREGDVKKLGIGPGSGANKWSADQGASEIVVVGYGGRGPTMKERNWQGTYTPGGRLLISVPGTSEVIDMVAPPMPAGKAVGAGVTSIKVSLPELQTFTANASYFTARLDDAAEVKSVVINDLDKQAKKALDDAWADIVTRTVIRVVIRTIATEEAKKRMDTGNSAADFLLKAATTVAADQMEKADIRMCFLLPKTIQIARIPVAPGTHSIALNVYDAHGNVVGKRVYNDIVVKSGEKKVVMANQLAGGKAAEETAPVEIASPAPPPVAQAPAEESPALAEEIAEEAEAAPEEEGEEAAEAASAPPVHEPVADSAKPRVAVYVAGTGNAEQEAMRVIVGGALAKAVKDAGRYTAKNLPATVLTQHGMALSGQVTGEQAAAVGKEFGVHYLCVVETGGAAGAHTLNARLADAATGETVTTASAEAANLGDTGQIMHAAQKIAHDLSNWETLHAQPVHAVAAADTVHAARDTTPPPPPPPPPEVTTGGANAIETAFVKGGMFTMGCTAEQGDKCFANEKPTRNVALNHFYIGKYEVTQKQWVEVMGTNPSHSKGDNLPVENVSWHEAQEFILKLNTMTGRKYRLPTEAEWEYAARGGADSKSHTYAGSNNIDDVAWYENNSGGKTHGIGGKAPNELGLHDMSGNVNEWVNDWLGPYGSSSETNPQGPSHGTYHVIRGGIWSDGARYCRVSSRSSANSDFKGGNLGFRLALSTDTVIQVAGADTATAAPAVAQQQAAPSALPLYKPQGRPFMAVSVRGAALDAEVKAAFASELLFDFVKSGLYRPVEDNDAFAAAVSGEAAKHGVSELSDERVAHIGDSAKADVVCVVDAVPFFDDFTLSGRIIDVKNGGAALKVGTADGKITTAGEFSEMAGKIAAAMINDPRPPAPPAQEQAAAPADAASPAAVEVHAAPREEPPAAPQKGKVRVSIGTGGFYAGGFGGGIKWESGTRLAMPYSGGGWHAFFDAEYVEIVFAYFTGGGKWVSAAVKDESKLPDMRRSGVSFGALAKIPFGGESVRGFPLLGIEYDMSGGNLTYESYNVNNRPLTDGDLSALWFKLGGGLDIALGQNAYLRSEFLFGLRLANKYENDAVSTEKTYDNSADAALGSGLSAKLGVGYKF